MAKVEINHNEVTNVTETASFEHIGINLTDLKGYMGVQFLDETRPGEVDLITTYNTFDTAGKAIVLEFIKKMTVGCFNSAMGTSYTWDQVPNSIFGS